MKPVLLVLGLAVLALLFLAIAGPLYQLGVLPLTWAFGLLRWAGYGGLAAVLAALVVGALAYRRKARVQIAIAIVAALLGLVVFIIPFQFQRRLDTSPKIHDVTTDLQNPPAFKAIVAMRKDAPNSLERSPVMADQQRRAYPDIA